MWVTSQHRAADVMNVTGGGAYDNKEVNEKKPGWFMFCKKQTQTLHLSAGKKKKTKTKHWKGKKGYSPKKGIQKKRMKLS